MTLHALELLAVNLKTLPQNWAPNRFAKFYVIYSSFDWLRELRYGFKIAIRTRVDEMKVT